MTAWEIIDQTLECSGLPSAEKIHSNHWKIVQKILKNPIFLNGFETRDKKFHFSPDWSQLGKINASLPKFPDHYSVTDNRNEERPFRLVTALLGNFSIAVLPKHLLL